MTIPANSTDNTALNPMQGGDTIATEDMPVGAPRDVSNLPLTDYKLPRSKIVVGPYDQDAGDADKSNPLYVSDYGARRAAEDSIIYARDHLMTLMATRFAEKRISLTDRRGNVGTRGNR